MITTYNDNRDRQRLFFCDKEKDEWIIRKPFNNQTEQKQNHNNNNNTITIKAEEEYLYIGILFMKKRSLAHNLHKETSKQHRDA